MTEATATPESPKIEVGDIIRSRHMGDNAAYDVKVLRIEDCESDSIGAHPAYVVNDPETGEEDSLCSRDFVLVSKGAAAAAESQPDEVEPGDGEV